MKEKQKKNKGITLIALVITIIVLLILAGVTIVTLTGDNGLLTKAGEAKQANEEAIALEKIKTEVAGSYELAGKIDIGLLNINLSRIGELKYKNNSLSETNKIEKLPDWVDVQGYKFDILEDGTVQKRPNYEKLRSMYGTVLNGYDVGKDLEETKKVESWKLLYVDEENRDAFFISSNTILRDALPTSGLGGSNAVESYEYGKKYNGLWLEKCDTTNNKYNANATAYLCNPDNWIHYTKDKAKYAVGGPTLEIIVASFYNKQVKDFKELQYSGEGASIKEVTADGYTNVISFGLTSLYYPNNEFQAYCLASPCKSQFDRMKGGGKGAITSTTVYKYDPQGLRPVVCFPASAIKIDGENLSV